MISNRRFCAEFLFKNCMIWIDFMQYCQFFYHFPNIVTYIKLNTQKFVISVDTDAKFANVMMTYIRIYIYIYIYIYAAWLEYAADADRHYCDQNVMCTRSGLVIKTAPVVRSSLSSRLQSESQTRGPRDLIAVCAASGSRPQPPSPSPNQSAADTGGADVTEATAGSSAAGGGGTAKTGTWRSSGMTRPRSLDFLSIVTRFQLARRARAVHLGTDMVDNMHDEDWMHNTLELDFISHNISRFLNQLNYSESYYRPRCLSNPKYELMVHSGLQSCRWQNTKEMSYIYEAETDRIWNLTYRQNTWKQLKPQDVNVNLYSASSQKKPSNALSVPSTDQKDTSSVYRTTKTINLHVRLTQIVLEQVLCRWSSDSECATAVRIELKPWNNE